MILVFSSDRLSGTGLVRPFCCFWFLPLLVLVVEGTAVSPLGGAFLLDLGGMVVVVDVQILYCKDAGQHLFGKEAGDNRSVGRSVIGSLGLEDVQILY